MKNYYYFFHQLLQLSRTFVNNLNDEIGECNLNHSQLIVLQYVKNFGTSTLVDIANYYNLEKSSITRTVHRLEKNGLIIHVPGKDKRERRIKLSELGEKVHAKTSEMTLKFDQNAMRNISETELEVTFQTLVKIMKNLNEFGERNDD